MVFKEFGSTNHQSIIMLHGGGLSWWSLEHAANALGVQYRVITPVIDGHGENCEDTFVSIEDYARKLISFIDEALGGNVYALYGLSIGAQIVTEVLSQRKDITKYAVIDSALVFPIKGTAALTVSMTKLSYRLIKRHWFAKLQAKVLFVPEEQFSLYFADSNKMSMQSLINVSLSNAGYHLKPLISKTTAKTLIIVGKKELRIMKKSARALHSVIAGSSLHVAKNMKHGELSLKHTAEFVNILKQFIQS